MQLASKAWYLSVPYTVLVRISFRVKSFSSIVFVAKDGINLLLATFSKYSYRDQGKNKHIFKTDIFMFFLQNSCRKINSTGRQHLTDNCIRNLHQKFHYGM